MIVKSLTAQLQNKLHVSAAEIDEQDTRRIIVTGVFTHDHCMVNILFCLWAAAPLLHDQRRLLRCGSGRGTGLYHPHL